MKRIYCYLIIFPLFICAFFILSCKRSTPLPTDAAALSNMIAPQNESEVKAMHLKHDDKDIACIVCHHKKDNDDRIKKCTECHESNEPAVLDCCIKCHEEKNKS